MEYVKDSFANDILEGKVKDDRFKVVENLILFKDRVYVIPKSKMKARNLRACHDTPLVGHSGFYKTYKQVRECF